MQIYTSLNSISYRGVVSRELDTRSDLNQD